MRLSTEGLSWDYILCGDGLKGHFYASGLHRLSVRQPVTRRKVAGGLRPEGLRQMWMYVQMQMQMCARGSAGEC